MSSVQVRLNLLTPTARTSRTAAAAAAMGFAGTAIFEIVLLADRFTFQTGPGAFATKMRNTPGPIECVFRYSAAIRYLRSPALR